MEYMIIIIFGAVLYLIVKTIDKKHREEEQEELRKSTAEKNHVLLTPEDRAESDRLMQTELFKELVKQIRENLTNDALWAAKYGDRVKEKEWIRIEVKYGRDEDDFGISYIFGVDLNKMGYKSIKNYDKIRVLFYSIGRLEGFYFNVYEGSRRSWPRLEVTTDFSYWDAICQREKIRLADEKNAGLKDFF